MDDSVLKAHLQPWNHLCVPEYITETHTRDLEVWSRHHEVNTSRKQNKKAALQDNAKTPRNGQAETDYDQTLIAVIGILNELKNELDVSDWIRSGRLWANATQPPRPNDDASEDTSRPPAGLDSGNDLTSPMPSPMSSGTPNANDIGHPGHKLWFDEEENMTAWVERGRRALDALEIEMIPGIKG